MLYRTQFCCPFTGPKISTAALKTPKIPAIENPPPPKKKCTHKQREFEVHPPPQNLTRSLNFYYKLCGTVRKTSDFKLSRFKERNKQLPLQCSCYTNRQVPYLYRRKPKTDLMVCGSSKTLTQLRFFFDAVFFFAFLLPVFTLAGFIRSPKQLMSSC